MIEPFEVTFARGKAPDETYMFKAATAELAIDEARRFAEDTKRWRAWGIRRVRAQRWVDVVVFHPPSKGRGL